MQPVFRVKLSSYSAKRPFYNRKSHKKSRGGCLACKRKRSKCDEKRPTCSNCVEKGITCVFDDNVISKKQYAMPNSDVHNLSMQLLESKMRDVVGMTCSRDDSINDFKLLQALQHYHEVTVFELGMRENQKLLSSEPSHTWSSPYHMHFVLALSNAHSSLKHGSTDVPTDIASAEDAHWQLGLQLYQKSIAEMKPDSGDDSLVLSTYLLSVLAFCMTNSVNPSLDDETSELMDSIDSLASAANLVFLVQAYPTLLANSAWSRIITAMKLSYQPMDLDDLPEAFIKLCRLREVDELKQDLHYIMLCHIVPLLHVQPCRKQLATLFGMIAAIWPRLRASILRRDHKTLLLLAWWLSLLARLDEWWMNSKTTTIIQAVLCYLGHHTEDELQPFLQYPASLGKGDCHWLWMGD